jgi:hypothetical protein
VKLRVWQRSTSDKAARDLLVVDQVIEDDERVIRIASGWDRSVPGWARDYQGQECPRAFRLKQTAPLIGTGCHCTLSDVSVFSHARGATHRLRLVTQSNIEAHDLKVIGAQFF